MHWFTSVELIHVCFQYKSKSANQFILSSTFVSSILRTFSSTVPFIPGASIAHGEGGVSQRPLWVTPVRTAMQLLHKKVRIVECSARKLQTLRNGMSYAFWGLLSILQSPCICTFSAFLIGGSSSLFFTSFGMSRRQVFGYLDILAIRSSWS